MKRITEEAVDLGALCIQIMDLVNSKESEG